MCIHENEHTGKALRLHGKSPTKSGATPCNYRTSQVTNRSNARNFRATLSQFCGLAPVGFTHLLPFFRVPIPLIILLVRLLRGSCLGFGFGLFAYFSLAFIMPTFLTAARISGGLVL